MKQVTTITVVGGGTAGLITAIILKKRLNLNINLIYSKCHLRLVACFKIPALWSYISDLHIHNQL